VGELLPRDRFVDLLAERLDVAPATLTARAGPGTVFDPVALLRIDAVVSEELGVELPEGALAPETDVDAIYRAYVLARVDGDLRPPGEAE
jgi:hypothetical protein